jgi:DNA-binding transcriptional ArsR family regulator
MATEMHRQLREPAEVRALAHPVRLELLNHLMTATSATASQCARAVGDTPSNCSYHLRVLARYGLVESVDGGDGRERPWRARLTGFSTRPGEPGTAQAAASAELEAVAMQREQRLLREHLAHRDDLPGPWRDAETYRTYTLRMTAAEATALAARLDAEIRPYLAATRVQADAPSGADLVHLALYAFPRRNR